MRLPLDIQHVLALPRTPTSIHLFLAHRYHVMRDPVPVREVPDRRPFHPDKFLEGIVHLEGPPFLIAKNQREGNIFHEDRKFKSHVAEVRHVMRDADCTHDLTEHIIKRRLVGLELLHAFACLERFVEHAGMPRVHRIRFGFHADEFALLVFLLGNVPDIIMATPANVFLGLVDGLAEFLVHHHVRPDGVLEPDEFRYTVYRCREQVLVVPGVKARLQILEKLLDTQLTCFRRFDLGPHIQEHAIPFFYRGHVAYKDRLGQGPGILQRLRDFGRIVGN